MSAMSDYEAPATGCFEFKGGTDGTQHICWLAPNHEGNHKCFRCDFEWEK